MHTQTRMMRAKKDLTVFLKLIVCTMLPVAVHAQLKQPANPYPPAPYPDRIVLNVTQDASTSLAVNWRTHDSIASGSAEIIVAVSNPAETTKATTIRAKTETVVHDQVAANYHSA